MDQSERRKRRELVYDPTAERDADEHALLVSALVRELQAHLDRVRCGEASAAELCVVTKMVAAARRAQRNGHER